MTGRTDTAAAPKDRWRTLPTPVTPDQYVETVDVAQHDDAGLSPTEQAIRAGG
jgi:hypothetical protein